MLLPSAGIYQAEDVSALSEGYQLDRVRRLFLDKTCLAEADADKSIVLRYQQRKETHAEQDGGVGSIVLLWF